jgi:hypothetical protein
VRLHRDAAGEPEARLDAVVAVIAELAIDLPMIGRAEREQQLAGLIRFGASA